MKTLAAVLVEIGKPLSIEEIEIPHLKQGQVLVEIKFAGVCHTQISETRGLRGEDNYLPHCLGHEGSGVVVDAGPGVTKVKSGDRVLLSWIKGPGADVPGTVYRSPLGSVNAGGLTTFSKHAVVSENRLSLLPTEIPFREAAILGCAVPTGVGAVLNTAQARAGQSAVVFGVGGIGLCAIAGAAIAGCSPIIAVDINPQKFEAAKVLGATHCIESIGSSAVADIKQIVPSGSDFAIEASGNTAAMVQSLQVVRNQGGIAVILGNAVFGSWLQIDPRELNAGKQLRGSWGGDNLPAKDFPRYFEFLASGKLDLSPLMSQSYVLPDINRALEDLEHGRVLRPLIELN